MGKYIDFAVRYNPSKDTGEDVTKRILYSLFIKRIQSKKPVVIFIGGDSGEGKSFSALRIQEMLAELQGYKLMDVLEDINVYTPLEYPKKLNALLGIDDDEELVKKLKKINILCMHEARDVVKAALWHSFLNQAISDVNAMSRAIKRLCFIVISQFIRDISVDVRYTLNYYITVYRPLHSKAQLSISKLWKDDSDLEKPSLRKRTIRGYLVYPNGTRRLYIPKYLEISMPQKEIIEQFEKRDYEAKASRIRQKTEQLLHKMEEEFKGEDKKIINIVKWYTDDTDRLKYLGKFTDNKIKINADVKNMYDLTDMEETRFKSMLLKKLNDMGLIKEAPKDG